MEKAKLDRSSAHLLITLVILAVISASNSAPFTGVTQAKTYFSDFGYLGPSVRNPSLITGELDQETYQLRRLPRCGVKDEVGFGSGSRSKRYALQGSRWSYKISKYPRLLNRGDVDKEVAKAFGVWSEYTDLSFTQKRNGPVHIEIRFEKGEHGDGVPFDGSGGIFAHSYPPVYGGDAHFDDAEQWSIHSYHGVKLFQVAAHIFGHSLGLSHSIVESALMSPFYRRFDPTFRLDEDDIKGIQSLYGIKTTVAPSEVSGIVPTPDVPGGPDEKLCLDPTIDTIFNSVEGSTYAFRGDNYWKLTEDGIAANFPRLISESWPGLPGNLDAAFTFKNGKTYFFKGSKYWRYQGKKMDGDYPKDISDGFTGIPDNLDAALAWSGNGKIFFYKDNQFWRFDPTQRPPVKSTYPKPLSNWVGVPNNIDAALQYTNGYTYFFKDGAYYRFNDRTFSYRYNPLQSEGDL